MSEDKSKELEIQEMRDSGLESEEGVPAKAPVSSPSVSYGDDDIEVLEGLEAIRKRVGMYLGSSDVNGLNHGIYEILDNSVDEAMVGLENGGADKVHLILHEDGSVEVIDNGRGLPVGLNKKRGKSNIEVLLFEPHSGGKFNNSSYKTAGGLHGVGLTVVNATSRWLEARVKRDGFLHTIKVEDGVITEPLTRVEPCGNATGTSIRYMPDDRVFSTIKPNKERIKERMNQAAYLNSGLTLIFEDRMHAKNHTEEEGEVHQEIYRYDRGAIEYLEQLSEPYQPLTDIQTVTRLDEETGIETDLVYVWVDNLSTSNLLAFTNGVRNNEGGTHVTGFKSAVTKSFKEFANTRDVKNLEPGDIQEGLMAIINIKVPENIIELEGQTKSKLGTQQARSVVDSVMSESLLYLLHSNTEFSSYIINRAVESKKLRERMRKEKDRARGKKSTKNKNVSNKKLLEPSGNDHKNWELFICEGDSAGGGARKVRNRKTQGVLALRGKALNILKASDEKFYNNVELQTLIHAIGSGIGDEYDEEKLRYDKVIILTDADVDGAHIQLLLLTFFFEHLPKMIEEGHVYIARPPLYAVELEDGKYEYYWDRDLARTDYPDGNKYHMHRFKGLGEQPADSLDETAINPETRFLDQVTMSDYLATKSLLNKLMGKDVESRKDWIEDMDFSEEEITLEDLS